MGKISPCPQEKDMLFHRKKLAGRKEFTQGIYTPQEQYKRGGCNKLAGGLENFKGNIKRPGRPGWGQ